MEECDIDLIGAQQKPNYCICLEKSQTIAFIWKRGENI